MSPARPAHRRGRMRRWLLRSGRGLEAAQGRLRRCPLVLGSIPWPAAPEPRGFPAEIPLGLQGREIFYGTGKKKALPTGPGAASSSALPCVSAGPWGWPVPTIPAPGTWQRLRCPRPSAWPVPDPRVSAWELPGCDPGAQRETEAGDVLGLAAPCSLWGGGTTRKGPSSPPGPGPGL